MQHDLKIHEVEKGVSALLVTDLSHYFTYAEKRSRQRAIFLQAMTLAICTAGAALAPLTASLSFELLTAYGLALFSTIAVTGFSRSFIAGCAARVIFVAISAHLLWYITHSSPHSVFWHSAICALIMVAVAPLHHEPISYLLSIILVGAVLILPHHSELANSIEGAWIGCLVFCALVFGAVINALFFYDRLTRYQLHRRLVDLAFKDSLTQINNRRALVNELEVALRRLGSRELHFLLIDVDDFKAINDTHGHDVGDDVLRTLADQIKSTAGERYCGRLGGEEFGAYLIGDRRSAEELASRLNTLISGQRISGVSATVSIGISWHIPGLSIGHLFRMADRALYEAKRSGKNCHMFADITTVPSLLARPERKL